MAEITYTKPTWVNGSGPAIDATELNALSTAVDQLTHAATRASAGKELDANTVSGYGIGDIDAPVVTDLGSGATVLLKNGIYAFAASCTDAPQSSMSGIVYSGYTAAVSGRNSQLVIGTGGTYAGYVYFRVYVGGSWDSWFQIWSTKTDGNGGQPPAAKSNRTSDTTIGWIDSVDCASGGTVTLPAGGTFETEVTTYGATYNSVKCAIVAGGAMTGTASANLTMRYKRLS